MPIFDLPFMKKPKPDGDDSDEGKEPPETNEDDELRLSLYKLIIDRYRDKIEEYETRTVVDLKGMIQPHNEKIKEILDSIKEDFHPYVYDEHFLQASKTCYSYVSSFKTLSMPVSFWLDFSDMQKLRAGDEIDKSIMLCSLLRSLGSENAKVFVTDTKKSYVLFQFAGKSYVAGHSQKELSEKETGEAALEALNGKILYSFNDKEYEDFQEGE